MKHLREFKEYAKQRDEEVFAYLIYVFLELWFKPIEDLESFRKWFQNRITKYNITGPQLEMCLDNYYDYWSNEKKKIKNFKTSFFNNPMLNRYLKPEYITPINKM